MVVAVQNKKGGDPDSNVKKTVGAGRSKLGSGSPGSDTSWNDGTAGITGRVSNKGRGATGARNFICGKSIFRRSASGKGAWG